LEKEIITTEFAEITEFIKSTVRD